MSGRTATTRRVSGVLGLLLPWMTVANVALYGLHWVVIGMIVLYVALILVCVGIVIGGGDS